MKYFIRIIFCCSFPAVLYGQMQNVQQSLILQIQDQVALHEGRIPSFHHSEKCAFGFVAKIRTLDRTLSSEENRLLKLLTVRPLHHTSILSSQGHFRIHFDTTGDNSGALLNQNFQRIPNTARAYADSIAEIFEYVWYKEILDIGYPAPPSDGDNGGDEAYDIYINEYNGNYYGETYPDSVLNPADPAQLSSSYIQIDNDYQEFVSSKGLSGARVTAAHEFFHAIQIGNYRLWMQDASPFFYEISSTWMENKVYPDVKDYIQYLRGNFGAFSRTDIPLNLTNGFVEYGRMTFAVFLERKYGQSIIHQIWDAISITPSLNAIILTLKDRGTSLESQYPEYALWHYYTNVRADTTKYFSDGYLYPEVKFFDQIEFVPPKYEGNYAMNQLAFKYFRVTNKDTATLAATNVDIAAAMNNTTPISFAFRYIIRSDGGDDTYTHLPNDWWIKLEADDLTKWKSIAFLQAISVGGDDYPYPNPFIADGTQQIVFPLWRQSTNAELSVYSSDLREVFHEKKSVEKKFGKDMIQWDGVTNTGVLAPSGIYYYILTVMDETHRGKLAILKK